MNRGAEARVAEFVHGARLERFAPSVIHQARRCFTDLLACSLAGIPARGSQVARAFAISFGSVPECSLFGDGRRVALPLAVLANTTACEALDADDGYNLVKGHPGAFLFPALLAFAERDGMTGTHAIETLVAGYEIGIRAGLLVHAMYSPAYHGSGSWGGIGTAAVTARCLRLDRAATAHALAAAEYHGTMAPIMRCVSYPGMTKDGVAWSAFAGVSAALLARSGFESNSSLFALDEAAPLVDSLGVRFFIEDLYFKPYCCCRWAHPAVRAALSIVGHYQIDRAAIECITVETFAEAGALSRSAPRSSEEAQYSVAYPLAAALLYGDVGPEQVLEGGYSDERVLALLARIEFRHRRDLQAEFPARRLAEVKIDVAGAQYTSGVVAAHGDPVDPMSDEEIQAKFRRYTRPYLRDEETEQLLGALARLEEQQNLEAFIAICPRSAPSKSVHPVPAGE
jgi:2-methylcitrate dehydratase PrpD